MTITALRVVRLDPANANASGLIAGTAGRDGKDGVNGRNGTDGAAGRDGIDGSPGIIQSVNGKSATAINLTPADLPYTQTDETGAIAAPLVKKVRQWAMFGDRRSITGNGTSDDTNAAQNELSYASANGLRLHFPDGMSVATTAPLVVSGWTRIHGRGGQLMKSGANPNALGPFTGFVFNHRGVGLSCVAGSGNFDMVDLRDFLIVRPQPASSYGNPWAPNNDDFDIDLQRVSGRIRGVECLRSKNFLRIGQNVGNYVQVDDIRGQVFGTGIQVLCALDNVEIGAVHFWPYWTAGPSPDAQPVLLYQLANHYGAHILRADGLHIENLFTYGARSTVLLDRNPATDGTGGVCNNGTFGKIYNDNGAALLTCSNASADQIFFRGAIAESYGSSRTAQNPSGNTINYYTGSFNTIDLACTNSHIDIGQYWSNNASGSHAVVQGTRTVLNIQRFIEGAWNGANNGSAGLTATAGQIQIRDWQKADGTTNPYSPFPTTGTRAATSGAGGVIGRLSSGVTTVATDANGFAFWAHNAGQKPNLQRTRILDGGSALATQFRPAASDGTNIAGYFYAPSGAPINQRSDVVVEWETFSGV
ncbi:hypothetical protein [Methylobacterium komagatae]